MATYLLKTEPDCYSYPQLVKDKRTAWDGVANAAARGFMRQARKGDEAFIYHTGNEKAIVGLAQIVTDPYEDPAEPGLNGKGEMKSPLFDIKPLRAAKTPVTLAQVKADPRFKNFELVRIARLGVMPVPAKLDAALRKMAGL
ncbi:MAG: EVE domain-containing protein [Phycisphaerales bacterium]